MTNQTNLDFLFQLTVIPERTANSATASNGHRGGFDDHLFQASSTSGSPNKSELRSNPADTTGQEQSRSINNTDERHSENMASGQTEAVSAPNHRVDDKAIEDQSGANEISADKSVQAMDDDTDEGGDGDTSTTDQSDEVVVAAAIADGEALRHSQTAAIAEAPSSSDQADASEEIASSETQEDDQVDVKKAKGDRANGLPNQLSPTASRNAGVGSPAEHSIAPTEVVDVGSKDVAASSTDLAASETGKPEGRKEKEKSNSRRPHTNSATTADGIRQNTEDSASRRTASSKDTPANFNPAAADLNEAEEKVRHSTDARIERRDEASASNNRGPVPEVAAAQRAQLNSKMPNADATSDSSRSALKPAATNGEPLQASLGRSQRSAGKGAPRVTAGQPDELPRVDAARFVGRVAKAVQVAHERGGSLQLRLSPPELGALRLELKLQNGVMTASLETETPAARQVLLDHLPALRDRLAEQNIRVERFDVDVRQEQQSGGSDPRASQQHERQHQPQQPNPRHSAVRTSGSEEITHDVVAVRPHATNSSINVLA